MPYRDVAGSKRKFVRIHLALLFFTAVNLSFFGTLAYGETFVGKAVNFKGTQTAQVWLEVKRGITMFFPNTDGVIDCYAPGGTHLAARIRPADGSE